MASLAHSAALAAVGARPGAGRRATAGRASAAARSHRGDVRTTVRAVGGKTVRHSRDIARAPAPSRAPSDPKAWQTLKRESTSKMGVARGRRDDDPSPAPCPTARAHRPDR
jgi:hypothetical protein